MGYQTLRQCVEDLEKHQMLLRVKEPVSPYLEMAQIHRRVHQAQGPAILFENVKGSKFPCVSNLFGTYQRSLFILRQEFQYVKDLFQVKADPSRAIKEAWKYWRLPWTLVKGLPKRVASGPIMQHETTVSQLPQITSWPNDGGPFILLPLVYSEDPKNPGVMGSNIGMYRVQLGGNQYQADREVGLHYQIKRDIGRHHTHAREKGQKLPVSVIVGGPPAWILSAVMYLPEQFSEACFAGLLAGRRFAYIRSGAHVIPAEADFCILGEVDTGATKPEGPFGDHLGYYSLTHEFPFLKVTKVLHRPNAIWPFTVVGRPPQEDSSFGRLVQELARPVIPREIPGVKAVHAVDAAGVHPLLLAIGKERYAPYQRKRRPQELLTLASALLGYGPCSLAKYLMIVCESDNRELNVHDTQAYFIHLLERIDFKRDLHFSTCTTMDTLDYSGGALNQGSKVVLAAHGNKRRDLAREISQSLAIASDYQNPQLVLPGIMSMSTKAFSSYAEDDIKKLVSDQHLGLSLTKIGIALVVICDDSSFVARSIDNFLWVVFTRSNPSHDIHGFGQFTKFKHWGCEGPLVIDARMKPHLAPALEDDPEITKRVDKLFCSNGSLHGLG